MEKQRRTSKFKAQVVLELLKGGSLEELSRKYAVTMSEINAWRDEFIQNGTDGFKRKPEEAKLSRAERKIGQLEMELELVKKKECHSGKSKKEVVMRLKEAVSGSEGCHCPMTMILSVAGMSSGGWYGKPRHKENPQKRGRKPLVSDEELLAAVKKKIEAVPFCGEGYQKVHRRLKSDGVIASKARVLKIMRENDLLSPYRHKQAERQKKEHTGTIITQEPDKMWATDGKKFFTIQDGWCWLFPVLDQFNDEIIAYNVSKTGNRFAAMEPVKEAVRKRLGMVCKDICKGMGLSLRADHGSQYDSHDFKSEMDFLGLEMSYSFVRSPECNGCIERFNRTIEKEVSSINTFHSLSEVEGAISQFMEQYNSKWMLHRLGLKSPIEYREAYETIQRAI
jgi:transposase InsO family protein/transposase-like protein